MFLTSILTFVGSITVTYGWIHIYNYCLVQEHSTHQHTRNRFTLFFLILWIVGILFGIFVRKWSFGESSLFVSSSFTTTGAVLINNTLASNLFTTFYLIIGVPLWNLTCVLWFSTSFKQTQQSSHQNISHKYKPIQSLQMSSLN